MHTCDCDQWIVAPLGVIKHEEQPVTVSVISKELVQISWSCLIAVKEVWVKKVLGFLFCFVFWLFFF